MIQKIKLFIKNHKLIPEHAKIILGLSGGPDSVFLLNFLAHLHKQKKITLIAAHLDHEWRKDSHKDVIFCKELSKKLDIKFVSTRISDLKKIFTWDGSKEELGRNARRYFLEQTLKEYNANLIALGHHLQDQEETFFIRLIRGSSLSGLTAMRPKNGNYIRPLLETNKKDIIAYLRQNNIQYLTDPSNESPEFLRNRIRTTVLPPLHAVDKRFDQNFLTTLKRLQETDDFLQNLIIQTFAKISQTKNNTVQLNTEKVLKLKSVIQYRILMYWLKIEQVQFPPSQKFLDEILRFFKQPGSKKHAIHEQWNIVKKKNWATIQLS